MSETKDFILSTGKYAFTSLNLSLGTSQRLLEILSLDNPRAASQLLYDCLLDLYAQGSIQSKALKCKLDDFKIVQVEHGRRFTVLKEAGKAERVVYVDELNWIRL